jgi:hypothetical protein
MMLNVVNKVTRIFEKIPNFFKSSQILAKPTNSLFVTSKLNFKVKNIYIKPLLKLQDTYEIPCFEAAYLSGNALNLGHA